MDNLTEQYLGEPLFMLLTKNDETLRDGKVKIVHGINGNTNYTEVYCEMDGTTFKNYETLIEVLPKDKIINFLLDIYTYNFIQQSRYNIIYEKNDLLKEIMYIAEVKILHDSYVDNYGDFLFVNKFNVDLINKKLLQNLEEWNNYDLNSYMKNYLIKYYAINKNKQQWFVKYYDSKLTYLQIGQIINIARLREIFNTDDDKNNEIKNKLKNEFCNIDKYIFLNLDDIEYLEQLDFDEMKQINNSLTNFIGKKIMFFDGSIFVNDEITKELLNEKYVIYKEYRDLFLANNNNDYLRSFTKYSNFDYTNYLN
jgi:hypothetical protein